MTRASSFAVLALVPLLAACPGNPLDDTVCTMEARPAVQVEVLDARTGASAIAGATVIVRDQGMADSITVREPLSGSIGLAHERAGTYEVVVRKEGYREWRRGGIRVERDECHVITARVEARLEPLQ